MILTCQGCNCCGKEDEEALLSVVGNTPSTRWNGCCVSRGSYKDFFFGTPCRFAATIMTVCVVTAGLGVGGLFLDMNCEGSLKMLGRAMYGTVLAAAMISVSGGALYCLCKDDCCDDGRYNHH